MGLKKPVFLLHWNNIKEGCKQQNPQSQEELYRACHAVMFKLCIRYATDMDEATAIFNEAMLKVFKTLHQFEGRGDFSALTWAMTGTKLVYTTSNASFYTNIVNQVALYNFQFKQAVPENDRVNLLFNNPAYQLLLEMVPNAQQAKLYTITLRPINKSQTTATQPGPKIGQTWLRFDKMGVVNQ